MIITRREQLHFIFRDLAKQINKWKHGDKMPTLTSQGIFFPRQTDKASCQFISYQDALQ